MDLMHPIPPGVALWNLSSISKFNDVLAWWSMKQSGKTFPFSWAEAGDRLNIVYLVEVTNRSGIHKERELRCRSHCKNSSSSHEQRPNLERPLPPWRNLQWNSTWLSWKYVKNSPGNKQTLGFFVMWRSCSNADPKRDFLPGIFWDYPVLAGEDSLLDSMHELLDSGGRHTYSLCTHLHAMGILFGPEQHNPTVISPVRLQTFEKSLRSRWQNNYYGFFWGSGIIRVNIGQTRSSSPTFRE